jgi:alpha-L-fucosidase 2
MTQNALTLWYQKPANQWIEALPVGNGRLGAMVFGGINNERIQLNEDTLWAGGPYDPTNPGAAKALPEARRLIFAGKYNEAQKLINSKMMGKPITQMPYQPVGDLLLNFPDINGAANYKRQLNLDTAITRTDFNSDGVNFTREVFSSSVDQVIVVRLAADKPGQISFTAALKQAQKATIEIEKPDTLVMRGVNRPERGIKGAL